MSRHCLDIFNRNFAILCLDIIFLPILKNSRKKLIFLENNCFRVSHMGCEARFLNLMIFLSFPQSNLIFKASFLNCTAAFFERFRFFQKGCRLFFALTICIVNLYVCSNLSKWLELMNYKPIPRVAFAFAPNATLRLRLRLRSIFPNAIRVKVEQF